MAACLPQVTSQKDRIEKTRGQLATNPKANDRMAAEESALQGLATKLSSEWLAPCVLAPLAKPLTSQLS